MTLAGYFMRSEQYNIFNALNFNSREYEKFKAQLLDTAVRNDYTNYNIPDMLTAVISDITTGRTQFNPFYVICYSSPLSPQIPAETPETCNSLEMRFYCSVTVVFVMKSVEFQQYVGYLAFLQYCPQINC